MIKTTVIPHNSNLILTIPDSYIGKEIEVLYYAIEEVDRERMEPSGKASRFKGLLSKEEGAKYQEYLKQARNEWDRDI